VIARTEQAGEHKADDATGSLRRRRSKRPLYALVVAYFISQTGTAMSGLAIPWLVLIATRSAGKTGLAGFAEMAPYVVMQATAGPLVDRVGLRRACVAGNATAAVFVCAIPGLYALGELHFGALIALVAVAGAVRGTSDAATSPLIPRAAAFGDVPNQRAAGLNSVAQRLGLLAGLPLAGVLIAVSNAATVVLIDGISFAVAALIVVVLVPSAATRVVPPHSQPAELSSTQLEGVQLEPAQFEQDQLEGTGLSQDAGTDQRLTFRAYRSQLREGLSFLMADRLLGGIALVVAISNLLDQCLNSVLIPVWVRTRLHHAAGLGLIGGAWAFGLVIGALAGTWLGPRMPRRATYAIGFLLGGSPIFIALAFSFSLPPVLIVGVITGLAGGLLNPILGGITYERVPPRLQARVLGAFRSSAWLGIPFGSLLGGSLTEVVGLKTALLATGGAMLLTTLAPFVFPVWRELDRQPVLRSQQNGATQGPRRPSEAP
jgi:MFS family permease